MITAYAKASAVERIKRLNRIEMTIEQFLQAVTIPNGYVSKLEAEVVISDMSLEGFKELAEELKEVVNAKNNLNNQK